MPSVTPQWKFKPSFLERVCLIGGLFAVFWYSWIMDDAFVYFRYVDNWVIHGIGLVWNPGEYTEGFSSPLWILLLGFLRALHLDYWVIIRGLALLSYLAFWYLACIVNRGLFPFPNRSTKLSYNVPLIYLSFTYAIACYFTSGLESPLVNISAVAYAAGALWPQSWVLQGIIGITPLIRHEFVLPFLLFVGWVLLTKKTVPIMSVLIFMVSVGGYVLFRVWYYADLFPNTFYLKDTTSIAQGFKFVYDSLLPYFTIPYMSAMILMYWILRRNIVTSLQRDKRLLMIVLGISVGLYVVKIGGDPRHFRYLAFSYILVVLATGGLLEGLTESFAPNARRYTNLFLLIFAVSIGLCFPRQLQQHPFFRARFGYSHSAFLSINDAAWHRLNVGITPHWRSLTSYLGYARSIERANLNKREAVNGRPPEYTQESMLFEQPLIADGWCQTAFLYPNSSVIQLYGLTESFLARTQMAAVRPGHKPGLEPLAIDLLKIRALYGFQRGAFDQAIADGNASDWIVNNIEAFRKIEKLVYNEHNLFENLALALSARVTIEPDTTQNKRIESDM